MQYLWGCGSRGCISLMKLVKFIKLISLLIQAFVIVSGAFMKVPLVTRSELIVTCRQMKLISSRIYECILIVGFFSFFFYYIFNGIIGFVCYGF